MSERFSDNLDLVAPADYVPTSALALLNHLHLDDADRARQEAGIRDWLRTHTPGRAMVFTLKSEGFGHLLEHRATA
ncbi:hypothetical protein EV580_1324 [Mycobacterium sp. BK086]|uniref:hypothetical protein n=1 Tax=Mycobacterium sp. BK086 TaxID=2512165 RepID=UPI00106106F8|nr:hypothetical protein [Mycobacterium sp. BK086]TDO18142.1 hypothetical protein EV580_1324 [Mycobacterium sp. BK086]